VTLQKANMDRVNGWAEILQRLGGGTVALSAEHIRARREPAQPVHRLPVPGQHRLCRGGGGSPVVHSSTVRTVDRMSAVVAT